MERYLRVNLSCCGRAGYSVCLSLNFQLNYPYIHSNPQATSTDLRKIRLESDLPERKCVCTSFRLAQFTHLVLNPVTQTTLSRAGLMCL